MQNKRHFEMETLIYTPALLYIWNSVEKSWDARQRMLHKYSKLAHRLFILSIKVIRQATGPGSKSNLFDLYEIDKAKYRKWVRHLSFTDLDRFSYLKKATSSLKSVHSIDLYCKNPFLKERPVSIPKMSSNRKKLYN